MHLHLEPATRRSVGQCCAVRSTKGARRKMEGSIVDVEAAVGDVHEEQD